jgi:hypothetical protein
MEHKEQDSLVEPAQAGRTRGQVNTRSVAASAKLKLVAGHTCKRGRLSSGPCVGPTLIDWRPSLAENQIAQTIKVREEARRRQ